MAWSGSKIFSQFLLDIGGNTTAIDLDTDVPKAALYDNDITPDETVSAANSAYNAGQWTSTGNEVFESGQWAQGGVALGGTSFAGTGATGSRIVKYDANDTASGSAADLAAVFGVLVYDDTITTPVADQGLCYNYLGGSNSIVNGTFTVVWHTNGIWRITL